MMKEKHIGEVVNNFEGDPSKQGVILVKCESLVNDGGELLEVRPSFGLAGNGFGVFMVPPQGAFVEIEIASGLDSIDFADLTYKAGLYNDQADIPDEAKEDYGQTFGFKSPGGNSVFMNDKTGKIVVKSAGGQEIQIDNENDKIVLKGSTIEIGSPANYQVMQAERFKAAHDPIFNALADHKHIDSNGATTTGPIPTPPPSPGVDEYSNPEVKVK